MAVKAIDTYEFEPADKAENFHGACVIYAGWDGHLLFSSPYAWPLPPDLPLAHFIAGPMAEIFGQHPDKSEEHPSELLSLMRTSSAPFCLKKTKTKYSNRLTT